MDLSEFFLIHGKAVLKNKNSYVFAQGEEEQFLYFVKSGLLKAFYVTEEGSESIKSFITHGDVIGSLSATLDKQKASFSLACLTECELVSLPFDVLIAESRKDINLANTVIHLLMQFAMKKERREYEFLCLSAEQRYLLLKQNSPYLLEQVKQHDLAKYLGVTAVGLSRIKKRVHAKKC